MDPKRFPLSLILAEEILGDGDGLLQLTQQ